LQVEFAQRQLKKRFEDDTKLMRYFGPRVARGIRARMQELRAATNLGQISHLPPPRLHALVGDRQSYFAVNVTPNVRLIFYGLDENNRPSSHKKKIVHVIIQEVTDYHDK